MPYFIVMTLARCLLALVVAGLVTVSAAQAPSPAAVLSLIGVAEQAIASGDDRQAETTLARIPSNSLDGLQLARVQLVRAEIGRLRRQPDTMLRSLPATSEHVPALAARIESLRGEAHFMAGDAVQAVRALTERERWLRSPEELAENRDRIWRGLIATPLAPDAGTSIDQQAAMARGWLAFAQVLQQGAPGEALDAWRQRYPGHPAGEKIALVRPGTSPGGMASPGTGAAALPAPPYPGALPGSTTLAVLLPLSGSLASGGSAVRDGLVASWFASPAPRPTLRFYDTRGDAGASLVAWETAARDGASLILGPLTKPEVTIIARQGTARPWIALNYVDNLQTQGLQFGLAPEDEARAAALDALASGRRQALALVPDNDWGSRAFQAFAQTFSSQGGRVLDHVRIKAGTQDFGDAMRQLLRLDGSRSRHQQLTQVLGIPSEFEPRPRHDANLLFAPLRAEEIRALAPQLAFFRAGRLTPYVISAAHAGRVDQQLEGFKLCDMPWVMSGVGAIEEQRARDALAFPQTVSNQPRLFALGRDAFPLAQAMLQGQLHHLQNVGGATGRLHVSPGGRVMRELSCTRVIDGRAAGGA